MWHATQFHMRVSLPVSIHYLILLPGCSGFPVSLHNELHDARWPLLGQCWTRAALQIVSHLSFLNKNFRKHLKHSSGLLLHASIHRQMLNRLILLLHLLSKRMHSPACLHILSSALSTLRVALYHSVFLVLAFTRAAFHRHQLAHGIAPALKILPTLTRIQFLVPMKTLSEQLAEQSRAGESAESATPHNCPCAPPSLTITSLVASTLLVLSNSSSSSYLN